MRTITLNDGTVFHVSDCGAADGHLWITITDDITMSEAVSVFCDDEKTSLIHHAFGENDLVDFVGYTELVRIDHINGMTITLKKG